jgi:hypothetical protein
MCAAAAVLLSAVILLGGGGAGAAATGVATSAPASQPSGPAAYQPGVSIDWSAGQVLIAGEVVLRSGDLELFACAAGTKEHESIVRVAARPLHIYQALGLVGFEPGHPPYFDNKVKQVVPATGERLEISVRWTQDGRTQTVPIEQWMYDKQRKAAPSPIDWVFAGSVPTEDGQIFADVDGAVLCLVDFDGAIIAVGASHSPDNASLWLAANTEVIPPVATPVTLIVQAARPRLVFEVDRFGRLRLNGRTASLRQFVEAARQGGDKAIGIVRFDAAASDIKVREIVAALRQAGLSEVSSEAMAEAPVGAAATQRTRVEEEGLAILQTLADISRQLPSALDAVAKSARDKYRALSERAAAAGQAAAGAARAFGSVQGPATQPRVMP